MAKEKLKDFEGAILDYTSAITINPEYTDAYKTRAYIYGKLEKYNSAIKDLDKAINIKPNSSLLNLRGFYRTKINDFKRALIDHSKAIEIDPYNSYSFNARAFVKHKFGDHSDILKTIN